MVQIYYTLSQLSTSVHVSFPKRSIPSCLVSLKYRTRGQQSEAQGGAEYEEIDYKEWAVCEERDGAKYLPAVSREVNVS